MERTEIRQAEVKQPVVKDLPADRDGIILEQVSSRYDFTINVLSLQKTSPWL